MSKTCILFICSDEHNRNVLGCYGDPLAHTPNLNSLAQRGTRFTRAYTPSPICGPARACLATGQYVHRTELWDSATPYDGSIRSWGHRLGQAGYNVASIGKLHYRSSSDNNGFNEEILPMHATDGIGWVRGLLRSDPSILSNVCATYARDIGPGETDYTRYDRDITQRACAWLLDAGQRRSEPWALFVSFICPHFPLIAPEAHFARYVPGEMPRPPHYAPGARPNHPVVTSIAAALDYDAGFDEERIGVALAGYYGLCTFLDANVGKLLTALGQTGDLDHTLTIFTSDHGDMLGQQGLWAKSFMYEGSVGVPMILAGPGVPEGRILDSPVSLVDCYPTILDAAGVDLDEEEKTFPGGSLLRPLPSNGAIRTAFSEYHDGGSPTGSFMLRAGRWKYVHYVDYPPQLFDLESDPDEVCDLGEAAEAADVRARCEEQLREIVDVDEANRRAFASQQAKIEKLGGVEVVRNWSDFGYTPVL